jgi:hypothetical protein
VRGHPAHVVEAGLIAVMTMRGQHGLDASDANSLLSSPKGLSDMRRQTDSTTSGQGA